MQPTQRPHIDGQSIGNPEQNLGGTVESGLDILIDAITILTRRTEINYLDGRSFGIAEQHVFGF